MDKNGEWLFSKFVVGLFLVRKAGGPLERNKVIESSKEGRTLFSSHSLTHTLTDTSHNSFLVALLLSVLVLTGSP